MEFGGKFAIYFAISALFYNNGCIIHALSDSLVNVAFGKPASQSSNYRGVRPYFGREGFTYAAFLAVDGNNSTDFDSDSCSHTDEGHMRAWWEVDLKDPYIIRKVRVFQISDQRSKGCNYESVISGKLENDEYMSLGSLRELDSSVVTINITTMNRIKAIRMDHMYTNKDAYLCLCEVEVFAAITCPVPTLDPRNSIYTFVPGVDGNFSYNSQIMISCKLGYQTIGSPSIQCLITSQWSLDIGTCEVITCPVPWLDSRNSKYNVTPGVDGNFTYNSNIDISCRPGYQPIGSQSIRCLNTSQWNEELGNCEVITCPVPEMESMTSTYTFTTGIDGNFSYNSKLLISCKLGYKLIGNPSIWCLNTSQWNGVLGNCKAITCPVPTLHSRSSTYSFIQGVDGNLSYNSIIVISCKLGYQLNGSSSSQCLNTSQWSPEIGNCEDIPDPMKTVGSGLDVAGTAGGLVVAGFLVALGVIIGVIVCRRKIRLLDKTDEAAFEDLSSSSTKTRRIHAEQNTSEQIIYDEPIELNDRAQQKSEAQGQNEYMNIGENSMEYYSNLPENFAKKTSIPLEDLSYFFLSRKTDPQIVEEEYYKLPQGLTMQHDTALLPENRTKNRYKDIYPYDDTRVQLEIWDPASETDYINACYVNGFKTTHAYIAAQGPAIKTLNDFWRMIWQTKSLKIVMLSNLIEDGKHKCEKYWPNEGTIEFGEISVRLVQCESFSDFTIRTLELKKIKLQENGKGNLEQRCLKQFHFTAWPDNSVPRYATSLVHFHRKVRNTKVPGVTCGPMVVHCSAGVGRTGTFLALDYLVDQAEELGSINFFSCVETLRKQRTSLVQNAEQYMFLHEALVEALTCSTSVLSVTEFHEAYNNLLEFDAKTRKRKIDLEFEKLSLYAADAKEDVYETGKSTVNRLKNRYSYVLPDNNHCPFLNVYVKGGDTYINAVFLPAYKENDIFIITQTPLENTKLDFWRMVYQFHVCSIVMLNTLSQMKDEERYWPEDEEALELPPFRITLESKSSDDISTNYTLRLRYYEDIFKVHLSRANYWTDEEPVPRSPLSMIKQIELIQSWQQETGNKPIIVHCMSGAERSGLFCVVAAVIERMKIEQDVAVEQMIKQMRSRRPQVIPNVDQFKFCYDAIKTYLEQYDSPALQDLE